MKTKSIISTVAMAFIMLISLNINAQKFAPMDKSPMDGASFPSSYKEANKLIKVVYSRPQLKGRSIEKLAPNGDVWRTGANEAVELTLYTPMALGDTKIAPGTYTFYVIPGEKEWTIILNSDLDDWGAYNYNEKNDVARIKVPVSEGKEDLEAFSIAFKPVDAGYHLAMGWGTIRVEVPFYN